jgi:AcrR family transcriptional regulator
MTLRRVRSARGSGESLRGEILDAARELLAGTGRADLVSIREISRVVGVSAPSIYRHFADKDALIDAVLAQVMQDMATALEHAAEGITDPLELLRQQGLAYVRFAREHPEQYRMSTIGGAGAQVNQVLGSTAFAHFGKAVQGCMDAGIFRPGDPIPVMLEMWAAAHGIASLLIAKPFLPWGDVEKSADNVLRAACVGHVVADLLDDPDTGQFQQWLREQRAD